jgi:multiple sugar transport system permease protein
MSTNVTSITGEVSSAKHKRQVISHQLSRWIPLMILAIMSGVVLAPIMWTISTSLRTGVDSFTVPPKWLPTDFAWQNYRQVFETVPFARQIFNSTVITWGTVLGQLITAALAGYAFARLEFKGRDLLFWVVLATMMIPVQATVIPVFILIRSMGLFDTVWSLILPATPTAFGAFLLRQYYLSIPIELEESGLIDGASQWQLFYRIYLPLVRPGLAVLAILSFNFHWNEFFRPLIFLQHENYPITIGIFQLQGYMMTGSISVVLAGVVVSLVPVIIIFLFGQRYLIEGIMRGAIKG